jgi:hypothetical protein
MAGVKMGEAFKNPPIRLSTQPPFLSNPVAQFPQSIFKSSPYRTGPHGLNFQHSKRAAEGHQNRIRTTEFGVGLG